MDMSAPPVTSRVAPCECHVLNPNDWPEENAKICIALCMHICPYCGLDFNSSHDLNIHLSTSEYKGRGLEVVWIPRKENELQRKHVTDLTDDMEEALAHDSTSQSILYFLTRLSQDTKQLLQGISLSGMSEISYGTRELWKSSTVSCPLVFGFQDCWSKSPPTTESVFLATVDLIVKTKASEEKFDMEAANGNDPSPPEEQLGCRAFARVTGEETDPWRAVAQLHEPSRHNPIAIIGYQLPEVLPDEAIKVPEEMFPAKAFNETNLQILLTPEFWVTNLLIDNFDAITTTLGPCEQVWLLFPPTVKNLQCMQKADTSSKGKLDKVGKYLEGGLIVKTNSSEVLYLPAGTLHAILTIRGGFLLSTEFTTSKSAKVLSSFLLAQFNDFKYSSEEEDILDQFLDSIKAAFKNNEVELALKAWVDALDPIRKWANDTADGSAEERKKRAEWNSRVAKVFDAFFSSPASKGIECPCGEANKMFSFQDHFRMFHLLAAPPSSVSLTRKPSTRKRKSSA